MELFPTFLPTFPSPSLPLFQLFSYYSTIETWNETRRGALRGGEDRVSVPHKPLGQVQSRLGTQTTLSACGMNECLHKQTGPKHHQGVHAAVGENLCTGAFKSGVNPDGAYVLKIIIADQPENNEKHRLEQYEI